MTYIAQVFWLYHGPSGVVVKHADTDDYKWWWAILPKAEGVGICLYNVTATDFLTHNKRYILWVPQWFSEQILSDECI